jgi:hypothetical protein
MKAIPRLWGSVAPILNPTQHLPQLRRSRYELQLQPNQERGRRWPESTPSRLSTMLAIQSGSRRSASRHRDRLHQDTRESRDRCRSAHLLRPVPCRRFRRPWFHPIPHAADAPRTTLTISSPACPSLRAAPHPSLHPSPHLQVRPGSIHHLFRRSSPSQSSHSHHRLSLPWPTPSSTPASA